VLQRVRRGIDQTAKEVGYSPIEGESYVASEKRRLQSITYRFKATKNSPRSSREEKEREPSRRRHPLARTINRLEVGNSGG